MNNAAFNLEHRHTNSIDHSQLTTSIASDADRELAHRILSEVMKFRRVPESDSLCTDIACQKCSAPHLEKIISAIIHNQPITFVLPAFPGKSPNPKKVLGPLPDQAERLALMFLGKLCQRIQTVYAPGINIILCSDGRVFSDVVGMTERHVSAYQFELDRLIEDMGLSDLSTFNLDDCYCYDKLNFEHMRAELMSQYGQSLTYLKQKVRNGANISATPDEQEANRMYRGITRFLFEDALYPGQTKSRTAIQKDARSRAYEVIRRSNAWSQLIAERYPQAVRLSIHPQTCGAKKLGIRLVGNESWMTPWHGVAVESNDGYILLKRSEAEALGATLINASDGRHSHYRLPSGVTNEV